MAVPGAVPMPPRKQAQSKRLDGELAARDRPAVMNLKGTQAYADWLDEFFETTHIPKTSMFRLAMADYAEKMGFRAPPPY